MKLKDNYGNFYEVNPNPNLKLNLVYKKLKDKIILFYNSRVYIIEKVQDFVKSEDIKKEEIISPITGKINSIKVKENDIVNENDVLLTIESMKMEMIITSPKKAKVEKIYCKENEIVSQGKILIKLKFLE